MNHPDRPIHGGDIQTSPTPGPHVDDRLLLETPAAAEGCPSHNVRDLDIRRKLSPRAKLLLALFPVALAAGAWFLGGGVIWTLATVGTAGTLLLIAICYLPAIDSLRRHQYAKFSYLVLCWGIWTGIGYFLPASSVTVKTLLESDMEKEPDCPMRITYGRQVQVELPRTQKHTIAFRGRFNPQWLKIETMTPTGWVERAFKDYSDSVNLEEIPTTQLYIDNRKHDAVRLGCGQLSFQVAAGSHQRLRIASPPGVRCPLTLDAQDVGTFAGEKDLLVDTGGTRSYRLRKIDYGGILDMLAGPAPDLFPVTEVVHPGHIHKLGVAVDYFLEDAPKEIKVPTFGGLPMGKHTRYELLEIGP